MQQYIIGEVGARWLIDEVEQLTDEIRYVRPSEFSELHRYLPESVSSLPGPMTWDVNPFMREIVDCFDVESPVREVTLMKGVQITYTTLLESGILYFAAHIKTVPLMYMTADRDLANARIENNVIPMLNHSGFGDIIRSSDEYSNRKTGKTTKHIQWEGGGYLIPFGAKNADKMRSFSILAMLKDEIDAWPDTVGKDGDPDKLSDDRCRGYWERRKIFRGSTPLMKGTSKIYKAYLRADQRKYLVRCLSCGFPQELRWSGTHADGERRYGIHWEIQNGQLITESVHYKCQNCLHPHYEMDKERLFSPTEGAEWKPTATPVEPNIRSYHLSSLYSPIGMAPWYSAVTKYLDAWDVEGNRVKDLNAYQVFYNNVLGWPFEAAGMKVSFTSVSGHRRAVYHRGEVPTEYAQQYCGAPISFITCQVDVHKSNLAVAIMGWTKGSRCFVIDYMRLWDKSETGCEAPESSVWSQLRQLLEEREYLDKAGRAYTIDFTLIDSGYASNTVVAFCAEYESGVYPIVGREKQQKEFMEYTTSLGTVGYKIHVDFYKDRLAPVLRREWYEINGPQRRYHFNAPIDLSDAALKELTRETKREKRNERGVVSYEWYRPSGAANELWDLLVYGHAAVEIAAWGVSQKYYGLEKTDMDAFWDWLVQQ